MHCLSQEQVGRPEQLDASVVANPDYVDVADTDTLHGGFRYNRLLSADSAPPQSGPVFHTRVSRPFSYPAVAGPLSAPAFSQSPPSTDYRPAVVSVPAIRGSVYDAALFNPHPFSQQFTSQVLNDRNSPPYQMNVDITRPPAATFDNFSALFPAMPPRMSVANSPQFYSSAQTVGYSSMFMSRVDNAGCGGQLQSSTASSTSQPWPPPPTTFGQLSRYQLAAGDLSVDDLCGGLLHNSAIGSDSLSSGSPVSDLLDHGSSPSPLPGAVYGSAVTLSSPSVSNVVESVRRTAATSPFSQSSDGLQLSRSVPIGVRFGSLHSGTSAADAASLGHHHAASLRMHYDSSSSESPLAVSHRSFFQPVTAPNDAATAFQVDSFVL